MLIYRLKKQGNFQVVPIIIYILLFLFLPGCTSPQKGYKLEKDKLVDMIIDHQIAKAAAYKYPVHLRDSISEVYYDQLFAIHKVDKYDFEQDLKKLESEPEYYKEVYDEVQRIMQSIKPKE